MSDAPGEQPAQMARDKVIRTGPVLGRNGKLTVLQLLEEYKRRFDEDNKDVFTQAVLNERFISGRQMYQAAPNSQSVMKAVRNVDLPPVIRNQLRNLSLTFTSRVNESTNDTMAWSDKPGLATEVAAVAELHLKHQKEKQSRPWLLARGLMRALAHGSFYLKTTMDPSKGKPLEPEPALDDDGMPQLDEGGELVTVGPEGEREGEIDVTLCTIFDVVTDGAEDIEHAGGACQRRLIDKWEAKALLMAAGFPDDVEPESAEDLKSVWDEPITDKVLGHEMWVLPCARIPKGLFALVIGDYVVAYEDYPLEHRELPYSCVKIFDRPESQYGDTQVTETIAQQRALNELTAALINMAYAHGANVYGVADKKIYDQIEGGLKLLNAEGLEDARKALAYVTGPPPPEMMLQVIQMLLESLPEAFGVNEVVASGGAPQQTKSARQLAYIKALDGQKLWNVLQSMAKALVRVDWQQTLLAQQYMSPETLLEIVGDDHALGVEAFFEYDLRTMIRIEPANASETTMAASAADAEESTVAGFMDPKRGAELRRTGLTETGGEAQQRRLVQEQIVAALHGEQVQPDPSVDPNVALEEIQVAGELWAKRNPQAAQALQALQAAYSQHAAEATQEQQQPMGRPTKAPMAEQAQAQQNGGMPT